MATITIPVGKDLETFIVREVREGRAESKAAVVRRALELLREERAFERIREAEEDVRFGRVYSGDLRSLLKKMPD